jgi:hypothetical protein
MRAGEMTARMLETAAAGVKSRQPTAEGAMAARLALICCAVLLASGPLRGQSPPACDTAPGPGQAAVIGRITDTETKLPLQEADIRLEWNDGSRQRLELESDEDGWFLACELPAGQRVRMAVSFGPANENRTVELQVGETQTLDFVLDAPRSRAAGRVVEHGTSRGIESAELRLENSGVHAVSRADGSFQLPDIPAGTYRLVTSHIGFTTREDSIEVRYGALMRYIIGLAVDVIELDPIEVAVRSVVLENAGFYARQERGMGAYLTRQSWEDRAPRMPSDVMRTVTGVRVVPRTTGFGNVLLDRGNCAFRYFVDGVRVGETFTLDDIPTEWIEALEVYRGAATIPPEFRLPPWAGRANCGVIVVWTRPPR